MLFNKLGDLYVKQGNITSAVEEYEKAINQYAEQGFPNNAIALCNKVLRHAPGRTHIYLKLAKLMMQRGFSSEAKQNLLEYAERMQKAGKLEDAFHALKEFADLSPDNEEIRLILAEQLKKAARTDEAHEQLEKLYQDLQASGDEKRTRATLEKMRAIDPEYDLDSAGPAPKAMAKKGKSSDIIFLDLDDGIAPVTSADVDDQPVEPLEPLDVVATSMAGDVDSLVSEGGDVDLVVETSTSDFGADAEVEAISPIEGLDVGESFDAAADMPADVIEIETTALDDSPDVPELEPVADLPDLEVPFPDDEIDDLPMLEVPPSEEAIEDLEIEVPWDVGESEAIPDVPDEGTPVFADESEPGTEHGVAEADEDTDFEVGVEVPDLDLAEDVDLSADEDVTTGEMVDEVADVAAPDISTLEFAVADDPDAPEPHRELGEALLEVGDRERGMQELDFALDAYQAVGDMRHAQDVVDEILRLDPNSIRHHQQRVEFALHLGEDTLLVDAYLALADALIRTEELERARVVYERVLERDPGNDSATIALETLVPDVVEAEPELPEPELPELELPELEEPEFVEVVEEPEIAAVIEPELVEPELVEPEAPAEPAIVEPVAPTQEDSRGFVDLGALIMDEEEVAKDTRMRIDHAEPIGQEQQDFAEMLSEFKKGIDANIDADDAQAHYDLGVAFKEMGLLDEAITEFQRALRGSEDRLRTSESLGLCFFEKGQFAVAATVLRRAIDSKLGVDEDKVGLLYWLGRCEEEQGHDSEALGHYQRIFSIDINFQDVSDRVNALSKGSG